jgi:general secretion pathway protein B
MSLLLEALKKSEDERANRRAGEPVYAGNAGSSGSRAALPLLAALVFGGVAAGLAAWVFMGGQGSNGTAASKSSDKPAVARAAEDSTTAAAPAPVQPAPAAIAEAPAANPVNSAPVLSTPPASPSSPTPKPEPVLAERSLYGNAPAAASTVMPEPPAQTKPAPAPKPAAQPAATAAAKPAQPPASAPINISSKTDTVTSNKVTADKESKPAASSPASIAKPAAGNEIIAFNDLPAELKAELPALRLAGYMHADDANDRLIAINDKLVRAGDEAAPGVRVQAITATVVVFAYKGYRFRVNQ